MASELNDIYQDLVKRDLWEDARRIAKRHHITPEEMFGRSRLKAYRGARIEFWSYLVHDLGWGLQSVARLCRRDHASILHGVAQYHAQTDPKKNTPKA